MLVTIHLIHALALSWRKRGRERELICLSMWCVVGGAQTLCLGQYREAFVDAAIDGSFLYDLTEDDLKNSLCK